MYLIVIEICGLGYFREISNKTLSSININTKRIVYVFMILIILYRDDCSISSQLHLEYHNP
ncbi:unnamed protein product [Schistosoma margrebowiei]|uniref:Uncharacterized protein n=1 Tax=Schistosoma margrebowiei TaxID=48269 RepID=A0A183NCQ9_9TREM|nr:unnamed protein product [Schistosoma margrebowiei]